MSMWLLIALLFVANKAFVNGEIDCEQRAYTVCNPEKQRSEFPGSEADLNAVCPIFMRRTECLHNYDEVCATKEEDIREFQPGQYEKIRELLEDVCSNSSLLHKVLSENMRCIKDTVEAADDTCSPRRSLLRKIYIAQREVDEDSESFEEMIKFQCLLTYDIMSCVTGDISRRCGDMTKSAVLEVTFRSGVLESERCPPQYATGMVDLVNELELPAEQKQEILDFISSYNAWASERN